MMEVFFGLLLLASLAVNIIFIFEIKGETLDHTYDTEENEPEEE